MEKLLFPACSSFVVDRKQTNVGISLDISLVSSSIHGKKKQKNLVARGLTHIFSFFYFAPRLTMINLLTGGKKRKVESIKCLSHLVADVLVIGATSHGKPDEQI